MDGATRADGEGVSCEVKAFVPGVASRHPAIAPAALPGWIAWVGGLLVPILVLGGFAFVFDAAVFDVALLTSLPVLLLWVGATTVALRRRRSGLPATLS